MVGSEGASVSDVQADLPFVDDVPQNFADCPAPGIHHDVPFEQYASWKAINSGIVKWGAISPKHMHAAFNGELKADDTRSMKLGRAIHCTLLEPETFAERFLIAGPCEAVLKSGERKGLECGGTAKHRNADDQWFCGKHEPPTSVPFGDAITENEHERCKAVAAALHDHFAVKLFRRKGWSEVSIVWEYAGFPMKCRLDRYAPSPPTIIDVKKCQVGKGDLESCGLAIRRYGWAQQAALYVESIHRITGQRPKFIWVFVEDDKPFDVQVIIASKETLAIGWHIAREAIRRYARAVKDGSITGYISDPVQVKPGGLPLRDVVEAQRAGWLNGDSEESNVDAVREMDGVGVGDSYGSAESEMEMSV